MLAQPLGDDGFDWFRASLRQIQRGLKVRFGTSVTIRHIRFLILGLEREGVIEREVDAWHFGRYGNLAQASRYRVINFYRAFERDPALKGRVSRALARERKRIKQEGVKARGILV